MATFVDELENTQSFFDDWWNNYPQEEISTEELFPLMLGNSQLLDKATNFKSAPKILLGNSLRFLYKRTEGELDFKTTKYRLEYTKGHNRWCNKNKGWVSEKDRRNASFRLTKISKRDKKPLTQSTKKSVKSYNNLKKKPQLSRGGGEPDPLPFGWAFCPKEGPILKKILKMDEIGFSPRAISSALNTEQLFYRGSAWTSQDIKKVLGNLSSKEKGDSLFLVKSNTFYVRVREASGKKEITLDGKEWFPFTKDLDSIPLDNAQIKLMLFTASILDKKYSKNQFFAMLDSFMEKESEV